MKIGVLCMPLDGHLNPMTALARGLQSRGHEISFISVPDGASAIQAAGLDYVPFCESKYPKGSIGRMWNAPLSKMKGMDAVRYSVSELIPPFCEAGIEELPAKIEETGVEALLLDNVYSFLELVPMKLGMPYVQACLVLPADKSGTTPPFFFSWLHEDTAEARTRNLRGLGSLADIYTPIANLGKLHAERLGLQIDWNDPAATSSPCAVIAQTLKEFDFPNIPWPARFHYTGPFYDGADREPIPFPWEQLNGKPLIYASLGSIFNGLSHIYRSILQAAAALPAFQLVLSVGHNVNIEQLGPIPSHTIVVPAAPQLEILKRAALCITHAGMNTTLEALGQGVPLLAIPNSFDQPGIASRISYHGVGEFIEIDEITPENLLDLMRKIIDTPRYRESALHFKLIIAQTSGLNRAVKIIDESLKKALSLK